MTNKSEEVALKALMVHVAKKQQESYNKAHKPMVKNVFFSNKCCVKYLLPTHQASFIGI